MTAQDQLESDALRAFAVFARRRSFTAAAAELHLSQPSLHVKIRKLATALGVELYQRQGRGLVLTPAGERLADFARDSLRQVDDFLADLSADVRLVRIAAGRATLRWVISDGVKAITRTGRSVRLITANREAALASVTGGQADLAVTALAAPPAPLRSQRLGSFPQVLVVGARHPLAARDRVRLADLAGLDLLVPPAGRPHRRSLEAAMLAAGVGWQVAGEVDGRDLLIHFAALGLGATVVNGCVRVPGRLRAVPITDLPEVPYWAAWRPSRETALAPVLPLLAP